MTREPYVLLNTQDGIEEHFANYFFSQLALHRLAIEYHYKGIHMVMEGVDVNAIVVSCQHCIKNKFYEILQTFLFSQSAQLRLEIDFH